jgi:hypothetical protein
VSWWQAEGNANDGVSTNNGTLVGDVTFAAGKVGEAFSFNGTNGYVQVGGSYPLTGARTVEAWVFPGTNTGYGLPIIVSGPNAGDDFFGIAGTTGTCNVGQYNLYLDHAGTTCYNSGIAVTPNTWNHVAMVYNGNTVQFYVNGVPGASVTGPMYNYDINTSTIGGCINSTTTTKSFFTGLIDELAVYSRALSSNEIAAIYNASYAGKCPLPPAILTQPANQTVSAGNNATFTAAAAGTPPLSYQWYFNTNTVLAGATNATLTLTGVQLTNAGNYTVVVSNIVGSATSSNAVLTVQPFQFTMNPTSRFSTSNGFSLLLTGVFATNAVVIDASTDLVNWLPILTNPPVTGAVQILDLGATNWPRRFYQATEQ